ncbi:MAG: Fic family protein [Tannerellaceae bacterium]|jgi:Fic family protein|nr:Fic family protein [Tannerellaceae bacterium]
MKTIEALYKEWQELQLLPDYRQQLLEQKFMLDFNYNSNHLEGNTLTYEQTMLLLIFGKTSGEANMRDYEEMKAHNAGLELVKREAGDRERTLSEGFIRNLNRVILVKDFYKSKPVNGIPNRYEVKVGVYKTHSNSVKTSTGEIFNYASPEETPALMTDLLNWYNEEEAKGEFTPIRLAALLHYRYIRIHPFEDGNGRIARLLVNYVLLRHGYPMLIVPTKEKELYLDALNKCDAEVGLIPSDGANATLEQVEAFLDYIEKLARRALEMCVKAGRGER